MKIIFIGCVESSRVLLEAVYYRTDAEIIGIVTKTKSDLNSDHVSLADFAEANGIDWLKYQSDSEMEEWIRRKETDLIYCFGWSHLLPSSIFRITKVGAVGYHPTLLPTNRGRHPIIWALILGLKKTGSTFFYLSEEADAGDILSQKVVEIDKEDDARTLYNRLLEVGREQVIDLTNAFIENTIQPIKQDHSKANSWRKRSKKDGLIDWRMSTDSILRLVRALTKPYVGAHTHYNGNDFTIWKAERLDIDSSIYENIEPGKVVEVIGDTFVVKTGDSVVKIIEHTFTVLPKVGEYL